MPDMTPHRSPHHRSAGIAVVVAVLVTLVGLTGPVPAAHAQAAHAQATPVQASADVRATVACAPTLNVSRTQGLNPSGEPVTISGACFDVAKGIYVALCVIPPAGQAPNPCGGGIDLEGALGASHWISSNPPPYAVGLTQPFGPGGSFTVTLRPAAALNDAVDCRRVACAIVSRADHTRGSDRTQDVIVPITFAEPASAPAPAPPPPPTPAPAPAPPPGPPPAPGPAAAPAPGPEAEPQPANEPSTVIDRVDPDGTTTTAPRRTTTTTTTDAPSAADAADGEQALVAQASDETGSAVGPVGLVAIVAVAILMAVAAGLLTRRRAGPS